MGRAIDCEQAGHGCPAYNSSTVALTQNSASNYRYQRCSGYLRSAEHLDATWILKLILAHQVGIDALGAGDDGVSQCILKNREDQYEYGLV